MTQYKFEYQELNKRFGKLCPCIVPNRENSKIENICPCKNFVNKEKCICGLFKKI
jgi:hypothetical protein